MDSAIRVVLVQINDETARRHCFGGSRRALPGVALRLLLLSLLCAWRVADLYLAMDQKQRLAFLSAVKLSARAERVRAGDVDQCWTARDFAAPLIGA